MKTKRQSGQALVELALVLPLLLILAFGIVEFGLLMYNKAVITNASREGARVGIVAQDRSNLGLIQTQIQNTVTAYASTHLVTFGNPTGALEIPTPTFAGTTFGSNLTVTVRFRYGFLVLPNFVTSLANPLVLQAVTVMKLE
jgi:Flp pilus assembly protein TadG